MQRLVLGLVVLLVLALALVYVAGTGVFGDATYAGSPEAPAVAPETVAARAAAIQQAGQDLGIARPKQILFGDLHVHSTFSFDAFQLSLPMAGGDGAHPVADACDYARHCSGLDFWSISDHGITLTPRAWSETIDSIRQCNAVAGDAANPDHVAYLGWEWTQVGTTPENHWGHKNVVLRDLADDAIPTLPITAGTPPGRGDLEDFQVSPFLLGFLSLGAHANGGSDFVRFMTETTGIPNCPADVPVRELPDDCREAAPTPGILFAKLREWGLASMVIPHGTTWGFYTPSGSSWEKQLTPEHHDPDQQRIIEVFSGHGNSEEYRDFREVVFEADGTPVCPAPTRDFLPSCWRAGEIIATRCLDEGESVEECESRAAEARRLFLETEFNGGKVVVGKTSVADWQDAGQCRDCFQPSFNYRPKSSVQYILSLEDADSDPERFRFGFIASSDNHSSRPGTGYKEVSRAEFTEARFGSFVDTPIGTPIERPPESRARPYTPGPGDTPFAGFETERGASFFLNGGLAAVHADGRDRDAIWQALDRKEVYGTSGPRILLWFDLLNGPDGPAPMGSEARLGEPPIFQVRAQGSFEQKPGCPADALDALGDRVDRLCQGECYHPSDQRRSITRIEVVRIRPGSDGDVGDRIEDPWRVLPCRGDGNGCVKAFSDPEYATSGRDAVYYVRAIEAESEAVGADPLGCKRDTNGRCIEVNPCFGRPNEDDCLAKTEERAWSSPIYVDQPGA
ncbi:MAG: DUF3604 domain-containing protein [Myxococcota bacterium]